jgi:hypothetical protein
MIDQPAQGQDIAANQGLVAKDIEIQFQDD